MQQIRLADIAVNTGTQIREHINETVVDDYAERMAAGDIFPPITVYHDSSIYHVADGFHRILAAKRNKLAEISADVIAGTKDDALWYALGANRQNGLRLTPGDKRRAIELALKTWPDYSTTRIAEQVGCAFQYVARLKGQVSTSGNLPSQVTGKDGKSYPARRNGKAKNTPMDNSKGGDGKVIGAVDRSQEATAKRREQIRSLAADGYAPAYIAKAVGISERGLINIVHQHGIVMTSSITKKARRVDCDRVVEHIVADASNLTAAIELIQIEGLDQTRLSEWIDSLIESRKQLTALINKLKKGLTHEEE